MNKYKSNNYHRRSIRLKGFDYSQAGLYFITICCQDMICRFGKIQNGKMELNEYGHIAYNEWIKLPQRFSNFEVDLFQIMPNHMHGIILLNEIPAVGAGFTPAQNETNAQNEMGTRATAVGAGFTPAQNETDAQNEMGTRATARVAPTVCDIVGAYKSLVANGCLDIYKSKYVMAGFVPEKIPLFGKLWQRNYFEHIIRNSQSYQTISEYILNNPVKWQNDKFYIE